MATTWNPNDAYFQMGLTNGNLTATGLADTNPNGYSVRSTNPRSSGKVFSQFTVTLISGGGNGNWGIGVSNSIPVTGSAIGADANSIGTYPQNGNVVTNNGSLGFIGHALPGDIIDQAADIDNRKIWWRTVSSTVPGNWNNDILANQNPATNTGGFAMPSGALMAMFTTGLASDVGQTTANFIGPFTTSTPGGFSAYTQQSSNFLLMNVG